MRWAWKKLLEYARRIRFYKGAISASAPVFKKESQAAQALAATEPVPVDTPDVVYDAEDDKVLDDFIAATSKFSLLISACFIF